MSFTFWILGLTALAALYFFGQRFRARRADRKSHEARTHARKTKRAETDRRDIHALTTSLRAKSGDSDPIPGGSDTPDERTPRRRASSVAPQGFDPDLPAR